MGNSAKLRLRHWALASVAVGAMLQAVPAWAADAEAPVSTSGGGSTLGELVVTAQKRSENIQKAPLAVTAFTGEQVAQGGLTGPQQLQFGVPSMTFGNNDGYNYISLRGVGSDLTVTAGESAVATYVDGIYTGGMISNSVANYDLERIEVLRGPQGTLYGRNTTGGVVNYITKSPQFEPGAEASASYGNYNAVDVNAGVTGPIASDVVAGRLSFHYGRHDGYRYDITLGRHEDADENYSGRASLLLKPNDSLRITLRGDIAHDRNTNPYELISQASLDGVTSQLTPLGIFSLPASTLAVIPGLLSPSDLARLGGGSIASFYGLLQPGPVAPDPTKTFLLANGEPTLFLIDSNGASATVDWDVGGANVKSLTGYRYSHLFFNNDTVAASSPTVFFEPLVQNEKQFTQEFDISGKGFDDRLDWLVGGFYLHTDADIATTVWLPSFGQTVEAGILLSSPPGSPFALSLLPPGVPFPTNFYTGPNILSTVVSSGPDFVGGGPLTPFVSIPTTAFLGFATQQRSQSLAGFAQATYKLTDRLRITGGFRYTRDEKNVVRSLHSNLAVTVAALFGVPSGMCNKVAESKTWTAPTGTVGIDFDAAPHVLTYAKVSWGYKAGGANPGECSGFFNPEHIRAYEAGLKSVFADGQILANFATYYYDYTDIQFTTYINNASSILNAGAAKAYGVELEYVVRPHALEGFQVDGSASYEHSEYGHGFFFDPANLIPPPGMDISGNELIRAPRWKANIGAQYTAQFGDGSRAYVRGEVAYTDTIYNDIFNGKAPFEAATTQPSYTVVNARLVWTSADRRYEFQVFGNNLTNKIYATNRVGFNTPATLDSVSGQFAPPRTFGARLTVRLGSAAR